MFLTIFQTSIYSLEEDLLVNHKSQPTDSAPATQSQLYCSLESIHH